jgi:adenylate cyclase
VSSEAELKAAIVFVDIVNYSAMMARDEYRTHTLWMSVYRGIIKPAIERHGGELIKLTGDGVFALFDHAGDAVAWATDVQEQTHESGADPEDANLRIMLRISIHFGSYIREEDDVFGDAVNITARLQQYAPPGGVIVSEAIFDRVGLEGDIPVRKLGMLSLRNMKTPVRAYLLRSGKLALPESVVPTMGTLPSVAVLPFENLSGDPNDNYLAAGLVEDIIVSLASLRELMVISRASTLMFSRENVDPMEVGASLGVHYVLMGNFRRSGRGVIISARLLETLHGEALWAERFDAPLDGLFDIQDKIVERVVVGIAPTVRSRELRRALRRHPETYSAYDCTLRALEIISNLDVDTFPRARDYLEQAMTEDANFAMAWAWAARWYCIRVGQGWSENPSDDAYEARRLAARAIELDPQNALALATCGHLQSFLFHDYESARIYLKRARDASPCSAFAWIVSSATESYLGHGEQAIHMAERGLRLSPKGHDLFFFYTFLSLAHYVAGAYDKALHWARFSEIEHPLYTSNLKILCASLVAVGRVAEAHEVVNRLMALEPGFGLECYGRERQPFKPPQLRDRFIKHLRQAGVPN